MKHVNKLELSAFQLRQNLMHALLELPDYHTEHLVCNEFHF